MLRHHRLHGEQPLHSGLMQRAHSPLLTTGACPLAIWQRPATDLHILQAMVADMAAPAGKPLAGVLHAGGVLRDAVLAKQTAQGVFEVLAPKVSGADQLLRYAGLEPLAGLQLFSSIAAAMGSGGQANYAAANATLDSYAHCCQAQVCPISTGAWCVIMTSSPS